MKTFREFSRAFFSIFLVLAGFIGCCESFNWMAELSTSPYQAKHVKENYGERYYPEEKQEELSPDTTDLSSEEYNNEHYYDYTY